MLPNVQSMFTHNFPLFDIYFKSKVNVGGEPMSMLRLKRKRLMLNQTNASIVLGIDNTYLSLIENKKRFNISDDLFLKICTLYQVSSKELKVFLNKEN